MNKYLNRGVTVFLAVVFLACGYVFARAIGEACDTAPVVNWEQIDSNTERLSIPGGWLVYRSTYKAGGMAFVPDQNHEWRLDN